MNPLTKVKLINELNEREAQLGVAEKVSWHSQYKDSAWIFLGRRRPIFQKGWTTRHSHQQLRRAFLSPYPHHSNANCTCPLMSLHCLHSSARPVSQDKKTGKSNGFCFLCYENQRSTILAVDNFNGIKTKMKNRKKRKTKKRPTGKYSPSHQPPLHHPEGRH